MEAFASVCVTRSKRVTTTPITTEKEKKKKKNSERSVSDTRSLHRTQWEHDIPPRVRSWVSGTQLTEDAKIKSHASKSQWVASNQHSLHMKTCEWANEEKRVHRKWVTNQWRGDTRQWTEFTWWLSIPCAFFSRLFAPSILAPSLSLHVVAILLLRVFGVRILQCFCRSRSKIKEDFAAEFFHSKVEWIMFPGSIIIHISKKLCVCVVCTFLCNGVFVSIKEQTIHQLQNK